VLHRATPERLSTFSDGVFAVLMTVLVLELRPPEQPTFKALLSLWPTWLSYAVSYLFIAIVWTNHQAHSYWTVRLANLLVTFCMLYVSPKLSKVITVCISRFFSSFLLDEQRHGKVALSRPFSSLSSHEANLMRILTCERSRFCLSQWSWRRFLTGPMRTR
jgi:hypothetical protein